MKRLSYTQDARCLKVKSTNVGYGSERVNTLLHSVHASNVHKHHYDIQKYVGRVSSVGIETCYGLEGPGIESRCGRDFPHPSRTTLGSTQLPV